VANATAIVKKGTVRRTDEFIDLPLSAAAAERSFYPNAMLGKAADGYVDKFDDTQKLTFVGVYRGDQGILVQPVEADGTRDISVHQPQRLEVTLASVAEADKDRLVYASDDQTASFSPGTYGNVIGRVVCKVADNIALVEPLYTALGGEPTLVMSGDGAITAKEGVVLITKGSAAALTLAAPTTGVDNGKVMRVVSTTAFAHTVTQTTPGFNGGGAGSDVGTFAAAAGNGLTLVAYQGTWYVTNNTGVTIA
jgi:hypothetical protein